MPRPVKIKRYSQKKGFSMRPNPHPVTIIAVVAAVAALVCLGIFLYKPIYNWIMGERPTPKIEPLESLSGTQNPDAPPADSEQQPTEAENQAAAPPVAAVDALRMIYLPHDIALDPARVAAALAAAPDCNAVMIDIKNAQGQLLYRTEHPASGWDGAVVSNPVDLSQLTALLQEHNVYLAVRMAAFSDPVVAKADRERNAILYQNTQMLWLDNTAEDGGKAWANPYSQPVRNYLTEIAVNAAELGAKMIILDYAWFPDDPTGTATYAGSGEKSRAAVLTEFFAQLQTALQPLGARCAAYLPSAAILNPEELPASRFGGPAGNVAPQNVVVGLPAPAGEDIAANYRVLLRQLETSLANKTLIALLPTDQPSLGRTMQLSEYILYRANGIYPAGAA